MIGDPGAARELATSGSSPATRRRSTSSWARINRSAAHSHPADQRGEPEQHPHRAALPRPASNPVPRLRLHAGGGPRRASTTKLPPPEPVEENLYHFDDGAMAEAAVGSCPARCARRSTSSSTTRSIARRARRARLRALRRGQAEEWDDYRMQVSQLGARPLPGGLLAGIGLDRSHSRSAPGRKARAPIVPTLVAPSGRARCCSATHDRALTPQDFSQALSGQAHEYWRVLNDWARVDLQPDLILQ